MVENWNATVGPYDKVYHLGDVAMSHKKLPVLERLNGTKILIKGNHDIFALKYYTSYFKDIRATHELGGLILSHIPLHESESRRFSGNVHGHLHEKNLKQLWYRNVSVEQINYTPISLDQVLQDYRDLGFLRNESAKNDI